MGCRRGKATVAVWTFSNEMQSTEWCTLFLLERLTCARFPGSGPNNFKLEQTGGNSLNDDDERPILILPDGLSSSLPPKSAGKIFSSSSITDAGASFDLFCCAIPHLVLGACITTCSVAEISSSILSSTSSSRRLRESTEVKGDTSGTQHKVGTDGVI